MLVLLFTIYMAREAWIRREAVPPAPAWPPAPAREASKLAHWALMAVYAQILLGAIVRHSGASWAAGMGPAASVLGVDPLTGRTVFFSNDLYVMLNLLHRYSAVLVSAIVAWAGAAAWRRLGATGDAAHRFLIWLPLMLVLFQLFVGVGMIAMKFQLFMRTLHLGMAAALLSAQFLMMIELGRSARAGRAAAAAAPLRASSGSRNLS
jgi:heme A synthase